MAVIRVFLARPGFCKLVLVLALCCTFTLGHGQSGGGGQELVKTGSGTLTHTPRDTQNYEQHLLDLTLFSSGTLVIEIQMGSGTCGGSFDLFKEGTPIPTKGRPTESIAGSYDNPPNAKTSLKYKFDRPGRFIFCADGNWLSKPGTSNTYQFSAYVAGATGRQQQSAISLLFATTKDSKSVSVNFRLKEDVPRNPIVFRVYRSSSPTIKLRGSDPNPQYLGGNNVRLPAEAQPSSDYTVTLLEGTELKPDLKKPYIVVITLEGTPQVSQTYFRKWRLATVTHGFAGALKPERDATVKWTQELATALKSSGYADTVMPIEWPDDSVAPKPKMTEEWGRTLARRIEDFAAAKGKEHKGDVVDTLIVGHSRGTIVSAQALEQLRNHSFSSGLIDLVLLDPHPANSQSDALRSANLLTGDPFDKEVKAFQAKAQDPEILIPAGCGIRSITIWYQKTSYEKFSNPIFKQNFINLWGLGPSDNRVKNETGLKIDWKNLTDGQVRGNVVGHEEVHIAFHDSVILGLFKR